MLLGFILSSGGYIIHTVGFSEILLITIDLGGATQVRVNIH